MKNYQEIKKITKEATENPNKYTYDQLEELYDEITELIYDANHGEENEISNFVSDVKIYDKTKRRISRHSEPGKIREKIRDLLSEKGE
jgi:poly-D-alanine transfer protein DltD